MTDGRQGLLAKFRRMSPSEYVTLAEAMALIFLSAPVIKLAPFRRLGRLASLPVRRPVSPAKQDEEINEVLWALAAAAKRTPLRALCFEYGLTAQVMLRRRGVPSTLYYGVAPDQAKGVSAHVWVRVGTIDITGNEIAHRYAELARFPQTTPPPGTASDSPKVS